MMALMMEGWDSVSILVTKITMCREGDEAAVEEAEESVTNSASSGEANSREDTLAAPRPEFKWEVDEGQVSGYYDGSETDLDLHGADVSIIVHLT